MKYAILLSIPLLLVSAKAHAQILLEDPVSGTVTWTETIASTDSVTTAIGSTMSAISSSCAVAYFHESITMAGGQYQHTYVEGNGVLEFELDGFDMPASMTSLNFTARLLGLAGTPDSSSADLSVFLFDLADAQEDGLITEADLGAARTDDALNAAPMANGAFPEDGIDVTDALRWDLFGDGTRDVSTGFVLQAREMVGLVRYGSTPDARIEITVTPTVDTEDTEDTEDTDTVEPVDTTDTADSADTEDTDTDIDDPDVKCSCRTAGAVVPSLFSLLF